MCAIASMATEQSPNSANSQFFICFDTPASSQATPCGARDRRHGNVDRSSARAGDKPGQDVKATIGRAARIDPFGDEISSNYT